MEMTSIAQRVDAFVADIARLEGLSPPAAAELSAAFQELAALRAEYASGSRPFPTNRLDDLRRCSAALDELLVRNEAGLAAAYVDACDAIKAAEARRDQCRALLMRLNQTHSVNRWAVGDVDVVVQSHTSVELPASGSPARLELEKYLDEHGLWRQVSIVHRPALAKALQGTALSEQDRRVLAGWCPVEVTWRVSAKPRDARFDGSPFGPPPRDVERT